MKAYALASLKIGKKTHKASTEDNPVVIELAAKEFQRLEAMGAVREATAKEVKMSEVEDAEIVEDAQDAQDAQDDDAKATGKKTAAKAGKQTATSTSAENDTQAGGDTPLDI